MCGVLSAAHACVAPSAPAIAERVNIGFAAKFDKRNSQGPPQSPDTTKKPMPRRAVPTPLTRASPNRAVPLLSTVMLLAIIVTTTCQLRTGVARDMRT